MWLVHAQVEAIDGLRCSFLELAEANCSWGKRSKSKWVMAERLWLYERLHLRRWWLKIGSR